jgi:ABC-type nitrate/sulfonate/bicarbonate transport system substrate-binding protein
MKKSMSKKATYKQLTEYIAQLEIQVKNNQQAVYDIAQIFSDYAEMRGKTNAFKRYNHKKYGFGSDAEIPTRWSVFLNFFKTKYLQLKKKLAFKK